MKTAKLVVSLSFVLTLAAPVLAGEHPKEHPSAPAKASVGEHPKEHPSANKKEHPSAKKKEHPKGHEHPAGSKPWNKQMRKEFNKAVADHVRRSSGDGDFKVSDEELGKTWSLALVRVHKKRIVHLGGSSFFACADFKTVGKGKKDKLDLDFYATKGPDGWRIDKTLVHKVNGKPRYTYNEKNERVPAKE